MIDLSSLATSEFLCIHTLHVLSRKFRLNPFTFYRNILHLLFLRVILNTLP